MKETFERVEKKYVLSYEKYESLLKKLDGHIERDKYFNSSIRSIYYDNDTYQMIGHSMESPDYKEKIRVRAYEDNAKTVYIECVVIIMINGNMGDGIAVAGSFALIRFRSARGSAKDLYGRGHRYYLWHRLYWHCGTVYSNSLCNRHFFKSCKVWAV